MDKLTKDTHVFCQRFLFFGTVQGLREYIEDIGEWEDNQVVSIEVAEKQPFMTVDDEWLIDLIQREVDRQGCDNERSSESGDEMDTVEQLLVRNIKVDYDAIMKDMPHLFYSKGTELQIDLNDF